MADDLTYTHTRTTHTHTIIHHPTQAEVVADLRCILEKHGIRHCAVGGHSYGTIWAGWIIRALREHVKQAILLDPVSPCTRPWWLNG